MDEDQHEVNVEADFDRFRDIREVNKDYLELRIKVNRDRSQDLDDIHSQVDMVVSYIKRKFQGYAFETDWFKLLQEPWSVAKKEKKITTTQGLRFRTHSDVLKIFGYNKGTYQRGSHQLRQYGYSNNEWVWFPSIDDNEGKSLNNSFSSNRFEEKENKLFIRNTLKMEKASIYKKNMKISLIQLLFLQK